jgi:hypothetical protein
MEAQLCRIFENPRFIVTHRDPAKVVPSVANITQNWTVVFAEPVSNDAILKSMTEMCARLVEGHLAWRESAPDSKVVDVPFRDINVNNLDVVRKIYDAFGLPWSAAAEAAMANWSKKNPRDKHGKNVYSAESLGTTDDAIRARFSSYFSKYGALLRD